MFDSGGDLGGLDPTNSLDGPAINKLYIERGFDGLQCADDFKMNELSQWLIGGLVVDLVKTNIQSSTPEEKCKILAVSLEKVGYSVTECYNAPSGGLTNKICFNYNATTKQQNDKKVFLETYSSENGYQSWCKNKVGGGV